VATVASTDDRLQFELDTTEAEGRQVMLQGTAGAAAIKVEHISCIRSLCLHDDLPRTPRGGGS